MPAPCVYAPPFRRNVPSLFIVWIAGCDELLNVTWIGVYSFRGQLLERAGFVKPFGMQQFLSLIHIFLAVPKGSKVAYEGIPLAYVEPEYPNSVDQLVIKAVTGEENPEGVGIVGLHNIWSLGRVGRLGRPLIETVVTIGSYEHSGLSLIHIYASRSGVHETASACLGKALGRARNSPHRSTSAGP